MWDLETIRTNNAKSSVHKDEPLIVSEVTGQRKAILRGKDTLGYFSPSNLDFFDLNNEFVFEAKDYKTLLLIVEKLYS